LLHLNIQESQIRIVGCGYGSGAFFLKKLGFACAVGFLRVLAVLPYGFVARMGIVLGLIWYVIPTKRKHIVFVNLRLCFPGKTRGEYAALAREHLCHVARSYVERGIQWYGSEAAIRRWVQVESHIDLNDSAAPPTIFMGFHFVGIEVGCMMYSTQLPVASLYTRMSNTRMCDLAKRQRGRFGAEMIERTTSARKIIALLRSGKPVMLAADLDHGEGNSVYVPFFGVPACTLTSVSRLAKLGRARVVPFVTEVLPNFKGYKMTIHEPLADYPGDSDEVDARRMNAFLENEVMRVPAQYYWVHRRFKHRPVGVPGVY
jgi:KDO2-lipid IV(A) lauroyltransferase